MINKIINKETILYSIVGIITSILNILLFYILIIINIDYKIANIITLVIVKITAYVLNKNIVFKSKCSNKYDLIKEFIRFIIYRGLTLLIDYFGLIIFIDIFNINKLLSKIIIVIIVIIINYITGKKYVFKKKNLS